MFYFLKLAIILAAFVSAIKSDETVQNENENETKDSASNDEFLIKLDEKNFHGFIESNEFVVVFFYAPWCGHCNMMKPFYNEAARMFQQDASIKTDKPVVLAKVDGTENPNLTRRFQVQAYPTILIFRRGLHYEYEGPRREAKDIVEDLVKQASNDWKPPKSQVVVLTKANFTEFVESHDLSLVKFVSPGCGHCLQLAPNFEKAAKWLAREDKPIPLAKVDATVEQELSEKYKITGYPTLYIFRRGRHYEYKGGRRVNDIIDAMQKARSFVSKEVISFNQFNVNIQAPTDFYVLGLFDSKKSPMFEIYSDFASQYGEDVRLFHSFNSAEIIESLRKEAKNVVVTAPAILVFYHDLAVAKKEPKFRVFSQENPTFEELEKFVFKDSLPLVSHMTRNSQKLVYNSIKPICYVIYEVDIELTPIIKSLRDKVGAVARKFPQVRFVLVNETANSEFVSTFNLEDESESETNLVCVNAKSKTFVFRNEEDSIDEDEASAFVQKFLADKLKPMIRSEAVRKQPSSAVVKTVVGKTFDQMVMKNKRDVALAFVGLSNQQTDKFNEVWTRLAKQYASANANVEFAKIDMFKNDFPDDLFKPSPHQPTVYYVLASAPNKPIVFESNDLEDLKGFIDEMLTQGESKHQTKQAKPEL